MMSLPTDNLGPVPRVSIGMPVYNGATFVTRAIQSLLDQSFTDFELIISDNASTDETESICRSFESSDNRIRYLCNDENIGPQKNFKRVLELARAPYFMWAAHDDQWQDNFVSELAGCLEDVPQAVLATPTTLRLNGDGSYSQRIDRRASSSSLENLKILFRDGASAWFYGLYRRDWLTQHIHEMLQYPTWGGDILWLVSIVLRERVVGSGRTLILKTTLPSSFRPKTEIEKCALWMTYWSWLTRMSVTFPCRWTQRLGATYICWNYCLRSYVCGKNTLKTILRIPKVAFAATAVLVSALIQRGRSILSTWWTRGAGKDFVGGPTAERPETEHRAA